MISSKSWYTLTLNETFNDLNSDPKGLSNTEAKQRFDQFGANELVQKAGTPPWMLFLEQFKNFLIIILLAAALISGALAVIGEGDLWEPILIVIIVLFAAVLGFVQEYRSEQAMEALKKMTAPTATVIRDGERQEIPARELVPGDIVLLETGDRIPADVRITESVNLKVDEAPLTGESNAVEKSTQALSDNIPVGDRINMAHMGTTVVYGRGNALVVETGMSTEFGKIAGMLQEVKAPPTPLQISLDRVGKILGVACLVICALVAGIGLLIGLFDRVLEAFIWAVSLAVAAVPEALPAVVTICLALGVQRMAGRHALLRHLPAVETLGSTTYICSDKTGTLTQNAMTVRRLHVNNTMIEVSGVGYEPKGEFSHDVIKVNPQDEPHLLRLLHAGALCNDSSLSSTNGLWQVNGDPTEGSLIVLGAKAGIDVQDLNSPRIAEIPFTSESKRMTTFHDSTQGRVAYVKGAPEVILDSCSYIYADGDQRELKETEYYGCKSRDGSLCPPCA